MVNETWMMKQLCKLLIITKKYVYLYTDNEFQDIQNFIIEIYIILIDIFYK